MKADIPSPGNPHRVRVRCYDNGGETADRYTVVYCGRGARGLFGVPYVYFGMSERPNHPQGFGQHGEGEHGPIDRPRSAHLGKRIPFAALPEECRRAVLLDLKGEA